MQILNDFSKAELVKLFVARFLFLYSLTCPPTRTPQRRHWSALTWSGWPTCRSWSCLGSCWSWRWSARWAQPSGTESTPMKPVGTCPGQVRAQTDTNSTVRSNQTHTGTKWGHFLSCQVTSPPTLHITCWHSSSSTTTWSPSVFWSLWRWWSSHRLSSSTGYKCCISYKIFSYKHFVRNKYS